MRVAFDARLLGMPGVGRSAVELWRALRSVAPPDVDLVALVEARPRGGWMGAERFASPAGGRPVAGSPFGAGGQLALAAALAREAVDVHYSPHLIVPRLWPGPVVLTVHDLFPLEPGHARSAFATAYYRRVLPAAVRRARVIAAVSPATAGQLADRFGCQAVVVRPGVDHQRFRPGPVEGDEAALSALGVDRPYLLYLGTAKSHKNLPTLIAAHRRRPGLPPLVLAGPTAAEVAACGVAVRPGDRVRALGRVPDGAVAALLRGADAVALPSRREGVGLVALEAMACATAVVASDGEGVTDTVGDAALVVPAGDEEAWADALARVVGDEGLRTRLGACGRERALARTWPDAARAYIELFRAAAR